ncbi:MAG: hypothetical protein ABTQ25_01945, partial [Nitrosomonas ureae]
MNQETNEIIDLKSYIHRIRLRVHDTASLIQPAWEKIKFPFIAYWIFRFYYSILAAFLTFLYNPTY